MGVGFWGPHSGTPAPTGLNFPIIATVLRQACPAPNRLDTCQVSASLPHPALWAPVGSAWHLHSCYTPAPRQTRSAGLGVGLLYTFGPFLHPPGLLPCPVLTEPAPNSQAIRSVASEISRKGAPKPPKTAGGHCQDTGSKSPHGVAAWAPVGGEDRGPHFGPLV